MERSAVTKALRRIDTVSFKDLVTKTIEIGEACLSGKGQNGGIQEKFLQFLENCKELEHRVESKGSCLALGVAAANVSAALEEFLGLREKIETLNTYLGISDYFQDLPQMQGNGESNGTNRGIKIHNKFMMRRSRDRLISSFSQAHLGWLNMAFALLKLHARSVEC